MARHGHFWSLASLPLPLPRPLPEKHDMERDILVCSEPRGNTKTIGLRGSRRITRIISISMLDWRPVGLRRLKSVVIPKDTHAVVELVVEISYLEICLTSPNSKKKCAFQAARWGKDQKLSGLKGLGGSAGRVGISLVARLGKRGSARLEEFRLTNTTQVRLEAWSRRDSVSGWMRLGWRLDAGRLGVYAEWRCGSASQLQSTALDFSGRRSAPTDGRDWATTGFVAEGDAEWIGSLGTSGSTARLICSERPTAMSGERRQQLAMVFSFFFFGEDDGDGALIAHLNAPI
ncbi:hypothetical protein E5676_scaffold98G002670 [Cucumis melo var. makuwa]|uniref:Uncharacterized protein n=1 Tax=Cucumis melo var. makuwa TaxID=1194695 RepID=A0A5D3C1F6_CUCMM|nr:hypothetical protein E5676_scaffold98G002670 [Cucumis melo var. makuwa]